MANGEMAAVRQRENRPRRDAAEREDEITVGISSKPNSDVLEFLVIPRRTLNLALVFNV